MPIRLLKHCLTAVAISILLVGPQNCFAQIDNPRNVNPGNVNPRNVNPRNVVLGPTTNQLHTLAQNWSHAEAEWFYDVPQGSKLVPYDWFVNLEQPDAPELMRATANIAKLGYIPRNAEPSQNPFGLPVGFVRDDKHLGITCAACHTGLITHKTNAWLIDGAPALVDFEMFLRQLASALEKTAADSAKFDRFAKRVLGATATNVEREKLKKEVTSLAAFRKGYNDRNSSRLPAKAYGPGRVDAFGAILNEVTSTFAQLPTNHLEADAPVSYPFLWDTPQHDRVQWNGAAENKKSKLLSLVIGTEHFGALGRNIGEVLGVFGTLDASQEGTPRQFKGYSSSINKDSLIEIEESLRKLWSPEWPKDTFPIDSSLADKGKNLFKRDCKKCHDDAFDRDDPNRRIVAMMDDAKTDPQMILNVLRKAKTGVLKGRTIGYKPGEVFEDTAPRGQMLKHMAQRALFYRDSSLPLDLVDPIQFLQSIDSDSEYEVHADIKVGDLTISGQFDSLDFLNGLSDLSAKKAVDFIDKKGNKVRQDLKTLVRSKIPSLIGRLAGQDQDSTATLVAPAATPQLSFKYKARPLNGIWATAPYLHNGSVPNLDELLKPASKRVKSFKVGSREFDPIKVGFVDDGSFGFDTAQTGNKNVGHEGYAPNGHEYSDEERKQLIEYMKTL